MLSKPLNKGGFCSDSLYCRSNEQSDPKVAHENTPNAPPRYKNVIF